MQGRPKGTIKEKRKSILNKDKNTREKFNELYNTDDRLSSEYDYAFRDFHIVKNDDYSEFDVEKCQEDLNKQKQEILNKVKQRIENTKI